MYIIHFGITASTQASNDLCLVLNQRVPWVFVGVWGRRWWAGASWSVSDTFVYPCYQAKCCRDFLIRGPTGSGGQQPHPTAPAPGLAHL